MTRKQPLLVVLVIAVLVPAALAAAPVLQASSPSDPGWFSVVPPLAAIAIALITRNVVPALFIGVWLGAWGVLGLGPVDLLTAVPYAFEGYVLGGLTSEDDGAGRLSIVLFSLMIGGMVGIIMRNGGMQGIVDRVAGWTRTPRGGQVTTSLLGLGIFFDDYANSLVVGNTMRPVTDRLRVSREKLAYLVDSTAAPVACLLFVTTWIGMEVGLIEAGLGAVKEAGLVEAEAGEASAYGMFLRSIPYSFYPILAMFFVLLVAWSGRDFGPMFAAERRARTTGETLRPGSNVDEAAGKKGIRPVEGKPYRVFNAVLPIAVMLITVLARMAFTGIEGVDADGKARTLTNIVAPRTPTRRSCGAPSWAC